ncbi:MAG: 50S ribosomal protein L4 [Deltaproteobacteria bacterium]|nr:MAG: 50S ribosomal protein L4 [Deltaproteobacteria bacterium]
MSTVDVVNSKNEKVGEIELNDSIFNLEVKKYLLHDAVRQQLAARRAGTACTKSRVEVSGGGSKPYRQKGTGRARAGSRTSPVWRGGGVAFGPKPRDYSFKLNRKVRRQALAMAVSARFQEGNLVVMDEFELGQPKTKDFVEVMGNLGVDNGLIVGGGEKQNLVKSSRNVRGFQVTGVDGLNVYDVLLYRKLILVKSAIENLEKRLAL